MGRACLTVPENPSMEKKRKKKREGVLITKISSVELIEGCGNQEKKEEEKGGRGGCHPKPHFGWF